MITVREAHLWIEAALTDLVPETIPLADALGRVLAEEIRAPFALPRFTNAAKDGFAVRVEDVARADRHAPSILKLAGGVKAGQRAEMTFGPGECVQVMTGALLPAGTEAVVRVENTSGFDRDPVEVYTPVKPRLNIRFEGEEIEVGRPLVAPGTRIGPAEHGVLASFGMASLRVYRRPRIALYGTGDELKKPGDPLTDGQIYDSNLPVLTDLARRVGAIVHFSGIIRDDRGSLEAFLSDALADCDVVVASGGVSMGKFDLVRTTLIDLGVEARFWQVAQKPGKPLFFGQRGSTLVFGLPGNPVSSFISFMEYLWPTLKKMQGQQPVRKIHAVLAEPFPPDEQRHRFLFGTAGVDDAGMLHVIPTTRLGSHMLTSALGANCIVEAPPGGRLLDVGDEVRIHLLPWGDLMPVDAA